MSRRPDDKAVRAATPPLSAAERLALEIELRKIITLRRAAEVSGVSEDGLRRYHAHLIRQLSPRRVGVTLGDALAIGELQQTPPTT